MTWRNPEEAPVWQEVIVHYAGPRCLKSQPDCVGTAVKFEDGRWGLGSFPEHREILGWKSLTPIAIEGASSCVAP